MNIINLAAACRFVFHDYPHGDVFHFGIGLETADFGLGAFGMGQDENARHPLDGL